MKTHSEKLAKALEAALVALNEREVVKLEVNANLAKARWIGVNERNIALFHERISLEDFKLIQEADLVAVYRQNKTNFEFVFANPAQIAQETSFDALKERQDLFYVQAYPGGKYKTRKRTYSLTQFYNQLEHRWYRLERDRRADIIDDEVIYQVFSNFFDVLDVDIPHDYDTYRSGVDYFVYKKDETDVKVRIVVTTTGENLDLVYYVRNYEGSVKVCGVYYDKAEYYLFADVKKDEKYADLYLLRKDEVLRFMNKVRYMVRKGKIKRPTDIPRYVRTTPYKIEHLGLIGAKKAFRLDLKTKTVEKYEAQ